MPSHPQPVATAHQVSPPRPAGEPVSFVYVGQTALTTVGPFTRRTYRFQQAGARLDVDARDAAGMAGVPMLRKAPVARL